MMKMKKKKKKKVGDQAIKLKFSFIINKWLWFNSTKRCHLFGRSIIEGDTQLILTQNQSNHKESEQEFHR